MARWSYFVFVASCLWIAFVSQSHASVFARTGFAVLAVLWIGFAATGISFARCRDCTRHQKWMQRSVALTFAAVTLRIIMAPLLATGWTGPQTCHVTAWGAWLLNLALLELWMRRGQWAARPA